MSLAQLLADAARAVDELQEQAQCAEQVASQVDAALQQAHRSLGYSLQEAAAERDLDHRHHRHLKASAAARGPAGVPAELTAERQGPAGGATRRCRGKAHRKHQHRRQHEPGANQATAMQPPQQQSSHQQRQRHAGSKRKQPEPHSHRQPTKQPPQLPLRPSPAAAVGNGHLSEDVAFATSPIQPRAADAPASRCIQQADAAVRSGGSGSSQDSDVEMVDAQQLAASAPSLRHCTTAVFEHPHPQPLQQLPRTDTRSDKQQSKVMQPAGVDRDAAAAASLPPEAATPSRDAPVSFQTAAAQRAGTAAGAPAPEVIVLSSSSDDNDDEELPAGLTRSMDRTCSRDHIPSPGVAAKRRPAAAAHHLKPEPSASTQASSPHAGAAACAPASSPLRAYSGGRTPPMLPAVMQDPHASGWTLQQPQSSTQQQQQQQQKPLTKASVAQRHQHTAAVPVGLQSRKMSSLSPPQQQQPTASSSPARHQQPPKAEAPAAQPGAQRHAQPPKADSPGQPSHQPPQHPMPPSTLPDGLLPGSASPAALPAEQPPSGQPRGDRRAPPPTMPAISAVTPQPAQAATAQQQSEQQWLAQRLAQRRRKRRVQLDDLLAQAQPAAQQQQQQQQQQQTRHFPAAVRENAFTAPSPADRADHQQGQAAGTAATAAAAAGGVAARSAAAAHSAPPSGAAQRPASAQSAKQGTAQHHQQPGGMPAATSARSAAAAPAASQRPAASSWQPPLQPAPTAQQRQQRSPPRDPAATPHLGATMAAAPGGGGTESDPVTLSSDSDAEAASPPGFPQPSSAASRHTGYGTAAASAATQRTLSSLFRFMAEHPPVPQRRRQQRPQPAAQQRPGAMHNISLGSDGSRGIGSSWPTHKAAAAKSTWGGAAGAGAAARTAVPTAASAQQPPPQPQQSRAARPPQPAEAAVSEASAAAAPDAPAPQSATAAATPAPAATADVPVVQQLHAVTTAPARAPGVTGTAAGMAVSAAGAAGAAAADAGAAAAPAQNGDDGGAQDQAVELDRQAAWAGPEARAADAAEWEARQAVIAVQAENARRLKLQRRTAAEAQRRAQERLEGHRREADAREALSQEREALRGPLAAQIQARVLGCTKLPQVLRALRQPIDGEPHPTPEQFLKAQKKALIKFHPDRYQSASVAVQVEAEEIFKIISKVPLTDPKPAYTWAPRRW